MTPLIAYDFHTHGVPPPGTRAIRSVESLPAAAGIYSLMLHPWQLPAAFAGLPPGWTADAARAAAIGEIGLDRLRGPELAVQLRYLEAALEVAAALGKPVIFHCVRCRGELLPLVRKYALPQLMIHGFAGGKKSLQEYLDHGFLVSLGRRALEREELHPFLREAASWRRLGLESDDEPGGVAALYRRAEELAGPAVREMLAANFTTFLGGAA